MRRCTVTIQVPQGAVALKLMLREGGTFDVYYQKENRRTGVRTEFVELNHGIITEEGERI